MSIIYRKATVDDKKSLWHFYDLAYNNKAEFLKDPYWSWLNIENPLQKDKTTTNTYIAIDEETNKIAGHYTVIPQNFYANGRHIQFSWGINLFVDNKYRGRGIAKKLQSLLIEEHDIYTAISIASSTRKMILNMEGTIVLSDTFTLSLPLIADKDEVFNIQLKYFRSNRLRSPFAFLLKRSGFLSRITRDVLYKQFIRNSRKGNNLKTTESFTNIVESNITNLDFLKLRSNLNTQFEAFPEDSGEYLNWKFERHPVKKYKLYMVYNNKGPEAFVVLRTGIAPEKHVGIISEVYANTESNLSQVIEFTKAYFAENKCVSAHVIMQHPMYVRAFKNSGFFITNKRKPVALAQNRNSIAFLENIKTWFFTFESQDLDFYPNTRL